ncbi:carbonic anhydrase family protein [Pontibacterium sp. N1Y112]|uniref:Carbonic anhydrase n=1 Tax=Pontibacterium sinense TaxID=2781979 RepID=A0A8J7KB07_9GAMM|nr:carbonic anhydrase family protein [Pontibacterium sinense]MBE9398641.1 carbonic anhydrase family protein [Pontibacterium sinense]
MKNVLLGACALSVVLAVLTPSESEDKVHWTYSGQGGPDQWGVLDKSFGACGDGKSQSPINITRVVDGELPALGMTYTAGGNEVLNNGHTIQVNYAAGNVLSVGERSFELKQFHFHAPSENMIQGRSFPMEAHFVHADKDGNLAVVAVMFKQGEENAELEKAWAQMPADANHKEALTASVDANLLLPENRDYYRFSGSLTTPPCSEGVNWFVMKDSVTASQAQIDKFTHVMGHPNNRPVQPIHARIVVQ